MKPTEICAMARRARVVFYLMWLGWLEHRAAEKPD